MTGAGAQPAPGGAAAPADLLDVRKALRLGWAIAELRGRYLLGARHVALLGADAARTWHALPLSPERSEREQKYETRMTLCGLAADPALDLDPSVADPAAHGLQQGARTSALILRVVHDLDTAGGELTQTPAWSQFTDALYQWDAKIQDALALRPTLAAGYQLGRGLAETYWALDPDNAETTGDWRGWSVLFGSERRDFLKRQIARLGAYFDPLTPSAISASLDAWGVLAEAPDWRRDSHVRQELYAQTLLWRDLLRGEREPAALIAERTEPWRISISRRLVRSLLPQVLVGFVSLAILVLAIIALAEGKESFLAPLAAVLGTLGVTGAGVVARAKADAQSLLAQLRLAYRKDLVGQAAIIRPHNPSTLARRRQQLALRLGAAPRPGS